MTVINASSAGVAALEIHWGNIGSAVQGVAALVLTTLAIIGGAATLPEWRAKLRGQRELAEEQTKEIRLGRRRILQGWSRNGVPVYGVKLVTDPDELRRAAVELNDPGPSAYIVLRVDESGSDVNRAHSLRNLIRTEGYVSRAPTTGECEALEAGREQLLEAGSAHAE